MALSRFKIAQPDILETFDKLGKNVYGEREMGKILNENRKAWRLNQSMTLEKFISEMIKTGYLTKAPLDGPKKFPRYIRKEAHIFEIALSLLPSTYICHYSAMYLHNLTTQIPKSVYINYEQIPHMPNDEPLSQKAVDRAFSKPMRTTSNIYTVNDFRIIILNGKNTKQLGAESTTINGVSILATNLERTLVDCTVRPDYAGGVHEVLNAFRQAKNSVSVNKMSAYLKTLNYKYPYQQSVGFYLEKAGYTQSQISLFEERVTEIKFYLAYNMKKPSFSLKWNIFYPNDFD